MNDDPNVIILGEDIIDPYGGAFKVTAGLTNLYPSRVITTPISEAGITGFGAGLALRGYKPIVEIMFGDFLTLCADQIVNHAAKFPLMYPNVSCPLILRTPMGGGRGYGPTHSQSIEKMFLGIPGLTIVAPSHFHKPGETLRRVSKNMNGPTIFIESKLLYGEELQETSKGLSITSIEDKVSGFKVSLAKNYSEGEPDVTIVSYGGAARGLPKLLRELAKEEIRLSAVLPECIDPLPTSLLCELVSEASRIIIIDDGHADFNWARGLSSIFYEKLWGRLQAPIKILSADRLIIPTSYHKEAEMLVNDKKIESAIIEVMSWQ